ncbi:MAG: hypothetical protein AAF612_04560 [Planctomycetota bacterium]
MRPSTHTTGRFAASGFSVWALCFAGLTACGPDPAAAPPSLVTAAPPSEAEALLDGQQVSPQMLAFAEAYVAAKEARDARNSRTAEEDPRVRFVHRHGQDGDPQGDAESPWADATGGDPGVDAGASPPTRIDERGADRPGAPAEPERAGVARQAAAVEPPGPEVASAPALAAAIVPESPPTTDELLGDAIETITREAMDPRVDFDRRRELAARAALLAVAAGDGAPPPAVLDVLGRDDARRVASLARVARLAERAAVEPSIDLAELRGEVDALAPLVGVRATTLELCKKVSGFGVYEPVVSRTFAVGREHQVIVYVELDGFASKPLEGDGSFEVRLQQELALFETSRGLAVWRQKPAEILDRSRNRRRDFFVVQMATLPADLPAGSYVLKVTGTDKNAGMVYAKGVEIEVGASELVADPAFTR